MVELPRKKVGIVACSGEELAEGTVTRLAALKVLENLRPKETVTICLPLFLAGGEGDRAFARFYPTIALDGCELRCAAKGTEMYSGKPAASIVVSEIVEELGLEKPQGCRKLNEPGLRVVNETAERVAQTVDILLGKQWNRRTGELNEVLIEDENLDEESVKSSNEPAACACGSGIPIQKISINGENVTIVGLPIIFEQMREANKLPDETVVSEILETVKIYNAVPVEEEKFYAQAIQKAYIEYLNKGENT
jgi:uncharacterized metal-binding protein